MRAPLSLKSHVMITTGRSQFNHLMIYLLQHYWGLWMCSTARIKRGRQKKNCERKHQTTAPFHAPAEEKETAKSGCVLPYICVVPASYVTACSRDGTPWERGADSLTCRCLRPTRASNLVVTWGGGKGGRRREEEVRGCR